MLCVIIRDNVVTKEFFGHFHFYPTNSFSAERNSTLTTTCPRYQAHYITGTDRLYAIWYGSLVLDRSVSDFGIYRSQVLDRYL